MQLHIWAKQVRGRARELADALGVKPPSVSDWIKGKAQVPMEQCIPIERFTNKEVTCEELRPDRAADFAYLRTGAIPPVRLANQNWDGVERRDVTQQVTDPVAGRREIDRADGFPAIEPA